MGQVAPSECLTSHPTKNGYVPYAFLGKLRWQHPEASARTLHESYSTTNQWHSLFFDKLARFCACRKVFSSNQA